MKRIAFFLIVFLFIFQACKKDDSNNNQPPQESVLDYMPLSVGNYWIYEGYYCDSGEVNCERSYIDTSLVSKDTLINGKNYFKIEGQEGYWKFPKYYRDSGDYIVNEEGKVVFTHLDTENTFDHTYIVSNEDTIYHWYYQLQEDLESVTVKAGTYDCLNYQGSFFRKKDDFGIEYNMRNNFAKNVGIVEQNTFFASSVHVIKRELIGYYIEPNGIIP